MSESMQSEHCTSSISEMHIYEEKDSRLEKNFLLHTLKLFSYQMKSFNGKILG